MERSSGRAVSACLTLLLILACLSGCSKEAAFYSDELPGSERFRDTTLVAVASDWASSDHSMGSRQLTKRLVVGAWRNYKARAFIGFSSLPDSGAEILSATLYLHAARAEGNVVGTDVTISALTDTVDQSYIFWDDLPSYSAEHSVIHRPPAESLHSWVVPVTGIVSSWVSKEMPNLGLVVKLEDEEPSGGDVIVEIASRETPPKETTEDDVTTTIDHRPALTIAYIDVEADSVDTLKLTSAADVFVDTLTAPFPADTQGLLCSNGVRSRCLVAFDVGCVPLEATVTKATLKLTPNLEESSFDSMSVKCHAALDPGWRGDSTVIGVTGLGSQLLEIEDLVQGNTIDMVITGLIQPLVSKKQTAYGLVVKSIDEAADIDFVRFFSSSADCTLWRPRLKIDYLVPPEAWYEEER
jgi:hypothetical protein